MLPAIFDWFASAITATINWYLTVFNTVAWITANILVAYVSVALVVFVFVYWFVFDPRATTGGQLIFRFMVSLSSVVGLIFISLFLDPLTGREWYLYPGDVLWWRPLARMLAYGYVAYSTTKLISYLIKRKWFPHKLKKIAPEEVVKVRQHIK